MTGLFSDIDGLLAAPSAPTAPREPLPRHFESAVRTFLTCASYQANRPFFRQGPPARFVPSHEAIGVTMTLLSYERVLEVGLFGTEAACQSLAQVLTALPNLSRPEVADALGEQMNLVAGRLGYQELNTRRGGNPVQLGLPNSYFDEQCATYRTRVIPLFGQQIACQGLDAPVWFTAAERSPYYVMGEAMELLERGTNRMALSAVIALLDEFRDMDGREDVEELKLIDFCKMSLVKRINGGPGNLDQILEILRRVHTARAPLQAGELIGGNFLQISVDGDDLPLVQEFIHEGRECVDAVDKILILTERTGVSADQVGQLFRLFHSIKGTSAMIGVTPVNEIAHGTETLLADVRDRGRRFDKKMVDFVFASSSLIRHQIELTDQALSNHGRMALIPGYEAHSKNLLALHEGQDVECVDVGKLLDVGTAQAPATPERGETVRVEIATIDRVAALVRGLTGIRDQLTTNFEGASENLTRVQDKLLQLSNEMSLVSCERLFARVSRLVRDLSRTLGKMVNSSFSGNTVRVSRAVQEALSDPITHLIRNSLDHGVESPEERKLTDKSALASVFIRVKSEGRTLVVEVGDDGRGINGARVLEVAKARGLVAHDAALTWNEMCALIFAPGFSTAAAVTAVSGRGVGLDVVKRNVEDLGGTLQIDSQLGRGTTFTLRIPTDRFAAAKGGFSESLEVLLLDDAAPADDLRVGEIGWF